MKYHLIVETLSPLCVSARHPIVGQATPSLDYIPGTALRGACAAELLLRGESATSPFFTALFKEAIAAWGNLYPYRSNSEGLRRSLPLPLTALSCKRHPGFKNDQEHGALDSLIARLTGRDQRLSRCPQQDCAAPLDDFAGFYVIDANRHISAGVSRRLIARTAISKRWGTAQSGSLYTLEVLNEGQHFSGYLDLPGQCDAEIRTLLQPDVSLRVGVARRRGLGELQVVNCSPLPIEPPELEKPLEERIDDLDARLHAHFHDERLRFALTLYADAVLLDDYQRYQTVVTTEALRREARFWPEQLRQATDLLCLERAFSRTRRVSGWNVAHGLPRPDDLAIVAGSVAVFSVPRNVRAAVVDCLKLIEDRGIGERTQEGFGRVIVNHPFHLQEDWV